MKDEALRLALEALGHFEKAGLATLKTIDAITAIKQALAEPEPVAWLNDLLRRAWDALDSFKQAYPENWNDEDQQVMDDLIRADLKLSGVKLKWQGLTDDELEELRRSDDLFEDAPMWGLIVRAIEAKLKEKNT